MPLPISVCILVHEDRATLWQLLDSLSFAKEVVCIDVESTISWSTVKLPKNTRVVTAPKLLTTNFSTLRNFGISQCKSAWTLMIDSDELLADSNIPALKKLLESNFVAARCKRIDSFLGKKVLHGEVGDSSPLRLFRTQLGTYAGAVHETLQVKGKITDAPLELAHISHTSISSFIEKVLFYSKVAALAVPNERFLKLKLITYPFAKFFYTFVLKSGWRDGYRGATYSLIMSIHSLSVRAHRYEQQI